MKWSILIATFLGIIQLRYLKISIVNCNDFILVYSGTSLSGHSVQRLHWVGLLAYNGQHARSQKICQYTQYMDTLAERSLVTTDSGQIMVPIAINTAIPSLKVTVSPIKLYLSLTIACSKSLVLIFHKKEGQLQSLCCPYLHTCRPKYTKIISLKWVELSMLVCNSVKQPPQ